MARIFHGSRTTADDVGIMTSAKLWRPADELFEHPGNITDAPALLLVDESLLHRAEEMQDLPDHVVIVAADAASAAAMQTRADISLAEIEDPVARARLLDAAHELTTARLHESLLERRLARVDRDITQLTRVGMALMHEHDRSRLLKLVVDQGKKLTESDLGGLLLVETREGVTELKTVLLDFDSIPNAPLPSFYYALDHKTIAGHAAVTKEPVTVEDVNALPPGSTFTGSVRFQQTYHYYARSLLAVPMLDQRDELLGVVYFVNRKSDRNAVVRTKEDCDRFVLSYTEREVRLARVVASIAAAAIENAQLHDRIEKLLESMVTAAVSAIDQRDPATAGHSLRVADLATGIAEAVGRTNQGRYRDVHFTSAELRELHFAALLHDLGKVTVREDVLLKREKLPPPIWERVNGRFDLIRRTLEMDYADRPQELSARLADLERFREIIRVANVPQAIDEPTQLVLADIAQRTFRGIDGKPTPYLTQEELQYLQISRGNLNERERAEIEGHVGGTRRFLAQIPWTSDLQNIVTYAYGHHEKLNGTGYPRGLRADEIPIQTRIITLADIFDALTEADRPYKPAMPVAQAVELLRVEADAGLHDKELVDIMVDSEVYRRVFDDRSRMDRDGDGATHAAME
jgi:HD-GYP domain-containing protein (c-di-GMP phosphodiesterase class II)